MREEDIDHIVSSSYVRAVQTVEGIAQVLEKEVEKDSRFREGGLADSEYKLDDPIEASRYSFKNPTFTFPGGESCQTIKNRGIAALKDVLEKYKGKK